MKKFTLFNLVFQGNLNIKKVATISLLLIASFLRSQTYYDVGKYKLLFLDEKYYDISDGDTFQVKTDYILIKLNDTISENRKQAFNSTFPITPQNTSSSQIIRYSINPGTNFIELVNGFDNSSDVQFYDINHLCPLSDIGRPNDNLALIDSKIINHPNLLWPYEHTGLFEAWQLTSGHSMIIVADLDNGIWENHPDLDYGSDTYSNLWINFGEGSIPDNVDNDQNGKVDDIHGWNFPADNNQLLLEQWPMTSHGTICSSIIAAKTNNNIGIWGVAGGYSTKGISVMMLNIRDVDEPQFIDDAFIPEAIDYAVFNGARIINMPIRIPYNESVETAIHFHFQSDTVFFLGSTGNDNSQPINFPARFEEVLAVGASECNVDDTLADEYRWDWLDFGSNYDTGIDVVAPGGLFIGNVIKENEQYVPDYKFKTYDSVSEFNISTSRAVSFASGVVALMLSANPCLTNDSIESILKRTADTISPEVNHYDSITGWSKWVGYGRINAFKALQPVIIPPIEVNTTWDSDMNIYNNINVEFGAELTIQNCTISISSWAKIIVKPGGKLILNNCILTGICNSIMWPGIEVWGYPNAPQFKYPLLPYPQGVIILNGATIENAVTAINLWKPDDYTMTGGIVEAYNSTFKNNVMSAHALYYRNFNPIYPTQELDYYGIFTNCSFIIDAQYLGDKTFYKHVDLCHVRGLQFNGCTFSVSHDATNISTWNVGLAAYNAGFYVRPYCPSHTIPCVDADSCRFSGFNWAIGVWAPAQVIDPPVFINGTHFNDNSTGIYINEHDYAVILENYLEAGYVAPYHGNCDFADGVGIDIHESIGFVIEKNKLRKDSLATNGNYAGIRVKNCRTQYDNIYKNNFDGLSYGNYAEGTNRLDPLSDDDGVEYQCNCNSHNAVDFMVQFIGTDTAGAMIRGWQGNQSTSSGNVFSQDTSNVLHFSNRGKSTINYYYCDPCTDEEPVNIFSWKPEFFEKEISNENNCPDHYGGGGHIGLTYEERLVKEESFAQNFSDYNSVSYLYESLIDGGDTETELSNIESAEPDDIWTLRSQLLGHSPHLSQEVLRAMAERTDVFPDEVLLEILSANPDELNRDTLIGFLEQKEDPLPDYMIDILRQAVNGVTYKTILRNELAQYKAAKTQAAQDIIRSILFDTVFNITDYRNWLDNLDNMVADRQIISSYLSENDTNNAVTLLNLLPSLYGLEGKELENYNDYKSLVEMQISWFATGKKMNEPDNTDINILQSIAVNEGSYAGNMARNILTYAGIQNYCYCLPMIDSSYLKYDFISGTNTLPGNEILKISAEPNPAHYYVAFNYELLNENSTGQILISDLNGKGVWQIQVNGKQGQKVWNTTEIDAGVYYYNLISDGFSKGGKIVIQ